MVKKPKISVIIPCYNQGQYAFDAVRSVFAQTRNDFEIIIVNDGSNDDHTDKLLQEISKKHPDVMVFNKRNGGLSDARNYGIGKARGDYIVCLDSDDALRPTYLEKTAKILDGDKDQRIGFVSTWIQEFGLRSEVWRPKVENKTDILLTNHFIAGSMFRKSSWEQVGGYKKEMIGGYEDWEFWLSIVESGKDWRIIEEPLFLYRIRHNSMLQNATEKHKQLYELLIKFHKKLFSDQSNEIIADYAALNQKLRTDLSDAYSKTSQVTSDYYSVNEELIQLKMSRVTRYVIKLRDNLVDLRTAVHDRIAKTKKGTRSQISRLIPAKIKSNISSFKNALLGIRYTTIENQAIQSGLPLVSIITPFYNHGATILETVDSVLGQSYQNFEYIIVNDGSNPENTAILSKIKDSRIKIITHHKNLGNGSPATARNTGIKESWGRYVLCLDADDKLDKTFLEKALVLLETTPGVAVVTTDTSMFGAVERVLEYADYNPAELIKNNIVITAAVYRKEAWEAVGGYKSEIGYEDWEFWIALAEKGYFGKKIAEKLFFYRTADTSRYQEDVKNHSQNLEKINQLHPSFYSNIEYYLKKFQKNKQIVIPGTAFINLRSNSDYLKNDQRKKVVVAVPWLTYGGAETLLYNFCRGLSAEYDFTFITGYKSDNEWEYRFREFSDSIYHLPNILEHEQLQLEFISNYISTRNVEIFHVFHCQYPLTMLSELKKRHPGLKIIVTMFNSSVDFFWQSLELGDYVDVYTSDNTTVTDIVSARLPHKIVIPILNGIDVYGDYSPDSYDRNVTRESLGVTKDDKVICFVGRLSEEKNVSAVVKLADAIKNIPNTRVIIVGDGPEKKRVLAAVRRNNKVLYLGYRDDVAAILSASDIFFLPSHVEGFPQTLVEAMALGNVLVTSTAGEMKKIVDDSIGRTFDSKNIGHAIEIIKDLLLQDKGLFDMQRNAVAKARKYYSYSRMIDDYDCLYGDLGRK